MRTQLKKSERGYCIIDFKSVNVKKKLRSIENTNCRSITTEGLVRHFTKQEIIISAQRPRGGQRFKQVQNCCQKYGDSHNTLDYIRLQSSTECYKCEPNGHLIVYAKMSTQNLVLNKVPNIFLPFRLI